MRTREPTRVLVVDDHEDMRNLLVVLLRRWNYAVAAAGSVAAAIETASRMPCQMLICDLSLPDGSGVDVLRGLPRPIPGVILSGRHHDDEVVAALDAGFHEHFMKPVDFDRLREALSRLRGR
jgi:DNA-binding response OmpR family regulator